MSGITEMFPEVVPAEDPNRRYTTANFMEWIRAKAGVPGWDLDVAADAESHWAPRWFSVQPYPGSAGVDGLAQSWMPPEEWFDTIDERRHRLLSEIVASYGGPSRDSRRESRTWRIFCNPPFDDLPSWIGKAWQACEAAEQFSELYLRIGFVLPGNRHEQPWWQEFVEPFRFEDQGLQRHGYRLTLHHPPGRQAYAKPGSNGVPVGSADFPSALLVWRRA